MEATMSATEADVYAKLHHLLVNGVCFDDSMSWQQALELMSSIDKALPDLYAGSTTGKFKILQKLTEMLQKSLQSCAQGAEKCELCGAESTEDDFYRQRLGSNPLGCGDGAGAQGEEDGSEEEEAVTDRLFCQNPTALIRRPSVHGPSDKSRVTSSNP